MIKFFIEARQLEPNLGESRVGRIVGSEENEIKKIKKLLHRNRGIEWRIHFTDQWSEERSICEINLRINSCSDDT